MSIKLSDGHASLCPSYSLPALLFISWFLGSAWGRELTLDLVLAIATVGAIARYTLAFGAGAPRGIPSVARPSGITPNAREVYLIKTAGRLIDKRLATQFDY